MAEGLTVKEVALMQGVSVQTVRAWVTEGLPVLQRGRRGGEGSIIDGTRLPGWLHRRKFTHHTSGDKIQKTDAPCGGNFLRWVVEYHFHQDVTALGLAFRHFYDTKDWQKLGIRMSDEKARRLAWRMFQLSVLFTSTMTYDEFEKRLAAESGTDLDGWASFLLESDFETKWTNTEAIHPPEEILELAPRASDD